MIEKNIFEIISPTIAPKIHRAQYGFRKEALTESLLVSLLGKVREVNLLSRYSAVISLDVEGAFDSVRHSILLRRSREMGRPDYFLSFISAWLSGRKFRVKLRTPGALYLSAIFALQTGLPQGGISSPEPWKWLVNELATRVLARIKELGLSSLVDFMSFADDATILMSHLDINILYNEIWIVSRILEEEYQALLLTPSPSKSKILIINPILRGQDLLRNHHDRRHVSRFKNHSPVCPT